MSKGFTKGSGKVWVVSEVFYPDEQATSHYMTHIAEGLAGTHSVHVMCALTANRPDGTPPPQHEIHNGVSINRFRVPRLDKNRLIARVANTFFVTLAIFFVALVRVSRGDVVLAVTNPPLIPVLLAVVCKLKKAQFILRVDDIYPDAMIAAGIVQQNSLVVRVARYAVRATYNLATHIVVIGRDMLQVVSRSLSKDHDKISVIPNWADLDTIDPTDRTSNPLLAKVGLTEKFVILIAGNIGRVQGIDTIVNAAIKMKNNSEIQFMFVGSGAKEAWVRSMISEHGLQNITLVPNQPRSQQSIFLGACDVALLSLKENMYGIGVPSRLYNYMAAAKPVIAVVDPKSEPALVIQEEKIGWVVAAGESEALVKAILAAQAKSPELIEMGSRARAVAEQKYFMGSVVSMYQSLMDRVISRNS